MVKFNEDAIREAAYYNWQNAGCPNGQDEYFWAMAVEQLSNYNKSSCSKSSCSSKKTTSKSTTAKSTKTAACKTSASAKKSK